MKPMFLIFLFFWLDHARAAEKFDYLLFGTAAVLHVIDLGQTLDIEDHQGFIETNPLIGTHPSEFQIYAASLTMIGLDYLALRFLSKEWRRLFLSFDIGMTAQGTYSNSRVGVKLNF